MTTFEIDATSKIEFDGWLICDFCSQGFTIWYERLSNNKTRNNGYIEDNCFCEECFLDFKER